MIVLTLLWQDAVSQFSQVPAWQTLPVEQFAGLSNVNGNRVLSLPGVALYTVPDGGKGWYSRGLLSEYDGAIDARPWYGLRLDMELENEASFEAVFTLKIPAQAGGRHNLLDSSVAKIKIQGKGWHRITVPFNAFDYNKGQVYFLKFLKQVSITGRYENSKTGTLGLRNLKLVKGNPLKLEAKVRSMPAGADSAAIYAATISNSSEDVQQVTLSFQNSGWEGMKATVEPAFITLSPGETKPLQIAVTVPALAPQGSQETQTLMATPASGDAVASLDFITLRRLNGPYLVHQEQGWQEVINKTQHYAWAKTAMEEYIRKADEFEVPETKPGGIGSDQGTPAVFKSYLEQKFWPVAVAYKLTGQKKYAEKIALLLIRLADTTQGYPSTLHANSQGVPQEGGFWEGVARSYDLIKDAGVLTETDKQGIEQSIRLYIYAIEDAMGDGGISNWSTFNLCPAVQCALEIQDMQHFNYLMNGPCGIKDHLRYGMMDDGWWYEVSLSYNLGCAENMTAAGIAAKPFGIDFLNENIPVALTKNVGLRPFEYENFLGMNFGKFGPVTHNYITVKKMWDAIALYPDYRGVMFGMGDGHEEKAGGAPFELAYFAYHDSLYAAIVKQSGTRDLIFGVPQLPETTSKPYTVSTHSDNAGVAVLRSQTDARPQREQIQAAIKYGTHGSYHGHFDRASLLSLMRYGRSFWNPETSWYGYGSYMYKWWVQTSMASNMVVVDGKMQEPKETTSLLFHSGKMMQAMAIETKARWSNPPYFGGYEQIQQVQNGDAPFVPVPSNHPAVAAVTDYTEPVLQRRLLLVTDDYVITADYLKANEEHIFDNLLHLRGALPDASLKRISHSATFDTSALSSGQFITNVDNYATTNGAMIPSLMLADSVAGWQAGGFNGYQEAGPLHIDAYEVYPKRATLRLGTYTDAMPVGKKLQYEVSGNGKRLAQGSFGAWLLGQGNIDVPVKGVTTLQLKTTTQRKNNLNTIFWANARLITGKGNVIPLSQVKRESENIIPAAGGMDYKNGPVVIAGNPYKDVMAAEPQSDSAAGILTFNLSGLDAVRLQAVVGGDFPVGEDNQVRKTISYRTAGKEARFITLLEPYENKSIVKKVTAKDAGHIIVELNDGRTQEITITGLDSTDGKLFIVIKETKDGKLLRQEATETPGQ